MAMEEFWMPEISIFCIYIPIVVTQIISFFILFLLSEHVVILLFPSRGLTM